MNPRQLTPHLSVSPQLSVADVIAAKALGFRSIIVNRPDGEEADQPTIAEMKAAAAAAGIGFAAIPVRPGNFSKEDIDQFADALQTLDGPAIAYCRTGVRATSLWALSAAKTLEPESVLKRASDAGYDLQSLRPALDVIHFSRI